MMQLTVERALEMAVGHLQAGRPAEAVSLCRQVLAVQPREKGAIVNLGIALHSLGQMADALAVFEQGVRIDPNWPEGWNNLGVSLRGMGRLEEALAAFRRALELKPDFPDALSNMGNALYDVGRPQEAMPFHERSIALRPDFVTAHCNLANALKFSGKIEEAIESYRRALELAPDDPVIHHYLGLTLLLSGDFERGLKEHEARIRIKQPRPICWDFPQPRWGGEPLGGRTILLHAEQGVGDTIQFVRYAPLVAGRGGKVILQCQPELVRLLKGTAGVEQVVGQDEPLPKFDVHCQLLSLPYVFGTRAGSVPAPMRYLRADPARVGAWGLKVGQAIAAIREAGRETKLKVGLCWAGRSQYTDDRNRSLSLEMFRPLAGIDGLTLISLQKGPSAIEVHRAPGLTIAEWSNDLTDFAETAGLIENLDLVISVDTSVAHLAGALGKPLWVLLPFVPDWRWGMSRPDSLWYPSARLLRQKGTGQWDEVIMEVAGSLTDLVL